eukprot:TRINITY_DN8022_c0_g1_i1.p1 TRINITY_DN8022_c0_g1~~TRINITY_DN8022_c0_g1_i1.p1  ORF type:complete len:162 (+),score=39.55 TRINITY_DN8022_c0_g1_i1:50-535(+)
MKCLNHGRGCNFKGNRSEVDQHMKDKCIFYCCESEEKGCSFVGSLTEVNEHEDLGCSFNNSNCEENEIDYNERLKNIEKKIEIILNEVSKPPLPPRKDDEEIKKLHMIKLNFLEEQNKQLKKSVHDLKKQNKEIKNQNKQLQKDMTELKEDFNSKLDQILS